MCPTWVLVVLCLVWTSYAALDHLEQRLSGSWVLKSCSCAPPPLASVNCTNLFQATYTLKVGQTATEFTAISDVSAQGQSTFTFVLGEAGIAHLRSVPYDCSGILTDQIICVNTTTNQTACTAKFDCTAGDCVGTVTQQRLRSIMYPVVGIIGATLWFGFPFGLNKASGRMISMVLAVIQGVLALTMLASPLVYVPLLILAASAFTFHVYQSDRQSSSDYIIIAAVAAWIFLLLGGLNFLANGADNIPFFESLMESFNSRECYLVFGSSLSDPRCREYLLYCGVVVFLIAMSQPALMICAWGAWSALPAGQ